MTNSLNLILSSLVSFFQIYLILLLVRVSLTWFPSVNWYSQPFYSLSRLTDPYLKMFRGIVPPLIGMDISPILGFILLQSLTQIVSNVGISTD
jgi:YggT family protein